MKHKRYYGEFSDFKGVVYRAEIWQDTEEEYVPEKIVFAKDAISIEWSEKDKMDVIRSSSATINLISKTDRKFIDLYTTAIRSVRLDIYRNDVLYWSGAIDPELYEEPYDMDKGYLVSITFSDFSVLKRLKWDKTGFIGLKNIVEHCVAEMGILSGGIVKNISTKKQQSDVLDAFETCSLAADNFYDEDNEADTLSDVLEYVLSAFGCFIQQKNGNVYLADYNTLCEMPPKLVKWSRTGSTLSVDKVYNNAKITFSAYEQGTLLDAEIDKKEFPKPSTGGVLINTGNDGEVAEGFNIYFGNANNSYTIDPSTGAKFFYIDPIFSGSDCRGVAYCCKPLATQYVKDAISPVGKGVLFSANTTPYVGSIPNSEEYNLKISMDLLLDVRYNPFEPAELNNEKGNFKRMQTWMQNVYIPIKLELKDSAGNILYHFKNIDGTSWPTYKQGRWVAGPGSWAVTDKLGDACLWYGNLSDLWGFGLGGWTTNKQCVLRSSNPLPDLYIKRGSGEYLPMPPCPGWLNLSVGVGFATRGEYKGDYDPPTKDEYTITRWQMYKDLKIEIVDKYGRELDSKDHVLSAWLDKNAEEAFELETHVGTLDNISPCARGAILDNTTKTTIPTLYRNGVTAPLEKLLCGTVYSQHATRKNKLTGTVNILPEFGPVSEKNTPGKFMLLGETQDLSAAKSEIVAVNVDSDSYEGMEIEDE